MQHQDHRLHLQEQTHHYTRTGHGCGPGCLGLTKDTSTDGWQARHESTRKWMTFGVCIDVSYSIPVTVGRSS